MLCIEIDCSEGIVEKICQRKIKKTAKWNDRNLTIPATSNVTSRPTEDIKQSNPVDLFEWF